MNINEAKAKIEERLTKILDRARAEGLYCELSISYLGKNFLNEETDEKKIRFISADVKISASEDSAASLSFGVSAECKGGFANDTVCEEDLAFAEARAEEFFEELCAAENKSAFIDDRAREETELREAAAEEIRKTVRTSWIGGIAALCVGAAILVVAAVVTILVL